LGERQGGTEKPVWGWEVAPEEGRGAFVVLGAGCGEGGNKG